MENLNIPYGLCRRSNMLVTYLTVFLFFTLLGAVFSQAQEIRTPDLQGDDSFANVIFRLEDGAMEQWRQGKPLRWTEISADDISYIDPGLAAPIVGVKAYREYLEPLVGKVAYDGSEYVKPKVARYGNTAVLTYNYHSLSKDKDGLLKRTSFWNTTEVYSLIAGRWKIVHTHWSYIDHKLPDKLEVTIPIHFQEKEVAGVPGELLALEAAAMERWRKGDPNGFLAISAPEVTYFDTGTQGRFNGLKELRAEYKKRENKIFYDVMEFINPRVQVYGDTAVLTYQFFSTVLNPDGTVKTRTPWHCSEVFAKIGGEWKIVHTHWSYIKGTREGGGI
jgi:ketosteroid isomerase-like protein